MKVGIMQPYFMPYIGYWQLIKAVDTYVVYDDVNFIKQGWINRNNILVGGEKKLFTITLNGASSFKLINEIEIKDNFVKFQKMIENNYSKAPYYKEVKSLMDKIIAYEDNNLGNFIYNSIVVISSYLGFNTKIVLSSNIEKDNSLKGQDKVLHICNLLHATEYYNAIGGKELYDKDEFFKHGIKLSFLKTDIVSYKQFNEEFIPGLSIIDVLMFNSPDEVNCMLNKFSLE